MGRAPCCDKVGLKKGRWTTEEDEILKNYIQTHGEGSWRSLPKNAGLLRCGKSCRLRWINYLRTDVKRGNITPEEEDIIVRLHATMGNRWSMIAGHLPGRTDNEIKNYWNSHLSRKIHYFRKPYTNTCANIQTTFDTDSSTPVAATATLPPPKRRGCGRVSRAAMKKNKQLYTRNPNKAMIDKENNMNNNVINSNVTSGTEMYYVDDEEDQYLLLCDGLVGPSSEMGLAVEDHCISTEEMMCFDEMVGPLGGAMNGGINVQDAGESSCTATSSSQFGENGRLDWEWDPYDDDHHEYDQLWMSMEEGSTGSEKEQIISWLWDSAEDNGFEEGGVQQSGNEVDTEKQEAMVAWLMS